MALAGRFAAKNMVTGLIYDDEVSLAEAEREPYSEPRPLPPPHLPDPSKIVVEGGKGRRRYYDPWPEPPEEYAWTREELDAQRIAAIPLRPAKTRPGGYHPDLREGEVGPCTRCGWVWYPTAKSLRVSMHPHRCSNCRTPDWRIPPIFPERDEAYHYAKHHSAAYESCKTCHPARPGAAKWRQQAAARHATKLRRKAKRLAQLASELGKQIVDPRTVQPSPPMPPPRMGHVIPPPPSFEDEQ